MNDEAKLLESSLSQFEGYRDLKMWTHAWEVLEELPSTSKNDPRVLLGRVEVLIGLREWSKAVLLGTGLRDWLHDPQLFYSLACAHAQMGNVEEARYSVRHCMALDPNFRLRILDEPLLSAVWN